MRTPARRAAALHRRAIVVGGVLALALLSLPSFPVAADWLVMEDGSRLETRGPWTVDGRQVVFHLPDGTLSSLRVAEVDLAASEELTGRAAEEAVRPSTRAEPSREAPARPRRKITNADVPAGVVRPEPAAEAPAETSSEEGERPRPSVEVASWERRDGAEGVTIAGTVRNTRPDVAASAIEVRVMLFGHEGELIAEELAEVSPSSLVAGGEGRFEARFPDVFVYAALTFRISSIDLVQEPASDDGAEASRP